MRIFNLVLLFGAFLSTAAASILSSTPEQPVKNERYLYYLHGGIVEGSDGRPVSAAFGPYEYQEILKRFETEGFTVISEIRPRGTDVNEYAEVVSRSIAKLRSEGVPGRNISVVGASQGGIIAAIVSSSVTDREINYVILAGLFRDLNHADALRLNGRVLAIHDKGDDHAFAPEKYFKQSPALVASKSIITDTGRGHGLVYRPLDEWFLPTISWIKLEL